MVFLLVMDRFKKGRPFVLQIISEFPYVRLSFQSLHGVALRWCTTAVPE
jgi:hypothetical protein